MAFYELGNEETYRVAVARHVFRLRPDEVRHGMEALNFELVIRAQVRVRETRSSNARLLKLHKESRIQNY